ncbi:MAG: DinB family protein [Niabella sp.]
MFSIDFIKKQREKFVLFVDELSLDELNKVPEGFNDNIIWNLGHIMVSSYVLMYLRTEANPVFQVPYLEKYGIGSRPEKDNPATAEDVANVKSLVVDSINEIEQDLHQGVFDNMTPFPTKTYGIDMKTPEDILAWIFAHDAMHFATAKAYQRMIRK